MTMSRRLIALRSVRAGARPRLRRTGEELSNRSIHIIVPFPAGGPSDVLARMIGQKMSEDFGQPVVIENRVGANTMIGAQWSSRRRLTATRC